MTRNSWLWLVVAALVGLVVVMALCAVTVTGVWFFSARKAAPTAAPEAPISGGEKLVCTPWGAGETRDLLPGQTALGDVEVDGAVRYDVGGADEGTLVVNLSSTPISIYAEWGAGCLVLTDANALVTNELFNTGCGPSRPCSVVRSVIVTDQGISETYYTSPLIP